jgi:arsenate reductase
LLRDNGVEPEIIKYLETPPSEVELDRMLGLLGMEPRELLRRREKEYKELGLADPDLSRQQLIAAMAHHPRVIERPIVVSGDRAVLGRPTERVLELL